MAVDDKTFEQLLIRYRPVALKIASAYSHAHREDIVQIVNLRVWQGRERLKSADLFVPWYTKSVHNTAVDYLRRERVKYFHQISGDPASRQNVAQQAEEKDAVITAIVWMLDEISPTFQPAVCYWLSHSCSMAEAAKQVGQLPHSFNVAVHRIRKHRKEEESCAGRSRK